MNGDAAKPGMIRIKIDDRLDLLIQIIRAFVEVRNFIRDRGAVGRTGLRADINLLAQFGRIIGFRQGRANLSLGRVAIRHEGYRIHDVQYEIT
ncbi:hypothetical protein D3C76_1570680 [compost metagenome]